MCAVSAAYTMITLESVCIVHAVPAVPAVPTVPTLPAVLTLGHLP